MKRFCQVLIALVVFGAFSSVPHHAFSPVYDGARTVTVAGTVVEFRFVNPHAQMELDVEDEAGNVVRWNVEFDGRVNLTNYGWHDQTISVGEHITVTGNPTHADLTQMFFMSLKRDDGSEIIRSSSLINSLEDQRRQRREQRRQ